MEKIVLVGNPNVGKSVIFNCLTGNYVTVSNYPGTTVDVSDGLVKLNNKVYQVIDTPGVNSLIPHSEDEIVTSNILLEGDIKVVINVLDSKNLDRSLILTLELIETGLPLIVVLNMHDEAKQRGINIDAEALSSTLGLSIVKTVAITKEGIPELKGLLSQEIKHDSPNFKIEYNEIIEDSLSNIRKELPAFLKDNRAFALRLLASDLEDEKISKYLVKETVEKVHSIKNFCRKELSKPVEAVLMDEKLKITGKLFKKTLKFSAPLNRVIQDFLGRMTLRPFSGLIILFFVLLVMYEFVGRFAAGAMVDFFENTIFKGYINPVFMKLFEKYIHIAFINELFIGEYGIITMALTYAFAIVLPIVTVFFIFFGLLEDSGYLPRLSALSDRLFSKIGLNGRAILPMVLGLGCGTMAVLTSRILDTKKERLLVTLLLALCIPCSAQLGVILGLLGSISFTGFIIWFLSILSSFVLVGFVASKIVKGEKSRFIQELPPIRIPKISNILVKTFARIKWYLKEAVPLFIAGTLFLFFLSKSGLLGFLNKLMNPIVVDLLNLPIETSSAFIVGFLRRDYGTAGLYMLYKKGMMTNQQVVVSLIVVTLFMPCIAQFLVTIKERGIKAAAGIMLFVTTYAILFGSMVNLLLGYLVSYKIISL